MRGENRTADTIWVTSPNRRLIPQGLFTLYNFEMDPFTFFFLQIEGGRFSSPGRSVNSVCKGSPRVSAKGGAHVSVVMIWDVYWCFL